MEKSIFICIFFLLLTACIPEAQKKALKDIRVKYSADDVTFHEKTENTRDGKTIHLVELIIINSESLRDNRMDFMEGADIAKKFFRTLPDKKNYNGIRVIITNNRTSNENIASSKDYYYDRSVLSF
jgi:hypothetical protein